jgi:hypothetical protein
MGDVAFYAGNVDEARRHYEEALALFRQAGNQRLMGRALGRLGRIACREGDLIASATLCAEATNLRLSIGHKDGMIWSLDEGYIELALAANRPVVAAQLLGAVDAARQSLSRPRAPVEARYMEPIIARLRQQLSDDAWQQAWKEGEAMSLAQALVFALDSLSPASIG